VLLSSQAQFRGLTMLLRHPANPLLRPADIQPSRPDFEVIGTFNPGAVRFGDEILLLVRVAERPLSDSPDWVLYPYQAADGETAIGSIKRGDPDYDTSDPRLILDRRSGRMYLTSLSHLRLARSPDGIHFEVDGRPWLASESIYEGFGIEDARITPIDGEYLVNYTAVSQYGVATALAQTRDFTNVKRCGIIFPPANRDVAIFPEKINGQYACYHRPMPGMFGGLHIWMATSPDLLHWGQHQLVLEGTSNGWEGGRIGGGAPPILTERGWLSIYHAADATHRYCLGAFLAAKDEPARVLARTTQPILAPDADYETSGFFKNVVFTCGTVLQEDTLRIYYGASDEYIALAEARVSDILDSLTPM
jgi:predicted GH43/DUF377 family glycosyl hydrolase